MMVKMRWTAEELRQKMFEEDQKKAEEWGILDKMRMGAYEYEWDPLDAHMQPIPKKRPSKKKPMPKPVADVYIPNVDSDEEIIDLGSAFEELSEMLHEEDMINVDDDIEASIGKLNNMYNRGQLQALLLAVLHDLIKQGGNDFVLIKHDAARALYERYAEIVKKMQDAKAMAQERIDIREKALKKLTAKEREILGI